MKSNKIWLWIVLAFMGYYGCSNMNEFHDQYLQRGEKIYVAQPDSVKIFSGKNRVKITYRNYDPKVARLTVYWDFRQGSTQFEVLEDDLGEDVEIIVDGLEEKQYTFELVTSNPVGQYPSIPLYISGPVYGSRLEASLTNRKIGNATIFPDRNLRTVYWAAVIETMVGVELKYRNLSDTETELKVPINETFTRFRDAKEDIMYRTLHLPENCIDTFYTDYAPINFSVIDGVVQFDKTMFRRWNGGGIPYQAYSGWDIENAWDGRVAGMHTQLSGDESYGQLFQNHATPGFLSPGGQNVAVNPWNFTFDAGQLGEVEKIKLYPREEGQQLFTNSHPKKIKIYASPTPDGLTADVSTWLYLGEFNSVRPSGLTDGNAPSTGFSSPQIDRNHARAGEDFIATENTDVAVRYFRFQVLETWQVLANPSTSHTVAFMEIEIFGILENVE